MTPVKTQKKVKQVIGKSLTQVPIIGMTAQQWELDIKGKVVGTTSANLDTNRTNTEGFDDATVHAFVDNIHDGNYICVPGSLRFEDTGDDAGAAYTFSMKLIEK